MTGERVERRLAAILAADVAGYSRLIGEDEVLRIGKITVGALGEWSLQPGLVTSWHPTAAAVGTARRAPVSSVPISYIGQPQG